MVQSYLWGPQLWEALFACAFHCRKDRCDDLSALLHYHLGLLLPCEKCRKHFKTKVPRLDRKVGQITSSADAVWWLYLLKSEVNRTERKTNMDFDSVQQFLLLSQGRVDDVKLADALVLVAVGAKKNKLEDVFVEFCQYLSSLLPLPPDSSLRVHLANLRFPILTTTVSAAAATRIEHGLPTLSLKHYNTIADEKD